MKTQAEIVARIKSVERSGDDFFGVQRDALVSALDYEHAKPFIKDDVTPDQWQTGYTDDESVRHSMHDYLDFAYGKAYGRRGLSANRSIDHYLGWAFLIDDELYKELVDRYDRYYTDYGLFILRYVDTWLQARGFAAVDPDPEVTEIPDEV